MRLVRTLACFLAFSALSALCACSHPSAPSPSEPLTPPHSTLSGAIYDDELFSVFVPEGWKTYAFPGQLQISSQNSGLPYVDISVSGSGVTDDDAKASVESAREALGGSETELVAAFGGSFYRTEYTASGVRTVFCSGVVGGRACTVTVGGNADSEEMRAILGSITFKTQ